MVADLNFGIDIVPMPIVREPDGLAMSSRNRYLSPDERQAATVLYRALQHAKARIKSSVRSAAEIIASMQSVINQEKSAKVDYIEIVDANHLQPVGAIRGEVLIALAVYFGKTRLIDNLRVDE